MLVTETESKEYDSRCFVDVFAWLVASGSFDMLMRDISNQGRNENMKIISCDQDPSNISWKGFYIL